MQTWRKHALHDKREDAEGKMEMLYCRTSNCHSVLWTKHSCMICETAQYWRITVKFCALITIVWIQFGFTLTLRFFVCFWSATQSSLKAPPWKRVHWTNSLVGTIHWLSHLWEFELLVSLKIKNFGLRVILTDISTGFWGPKGTWRLVALIPFLLPFDE